MEISLVQIASSLGQISIPLSIFIEKAELFPTINKMKDREPLYFRVDDIPGKRKEKVISGLVD